MDFDIYIIGGGHKMVDFLNSVAMYASTNNFSLTLKIGMAYGIMWLLGAQAFQKIKFKDVIAHILGVFIFIGVCINAKVDTYVHDPINPEISNRKVSNVPLGLAFLVSVSTKVDYASTKGIEMVFSAPDDLKFSHSGMMMGQDMVIRASQISVSDLDFKRDLSSFIQQCVIYDIQMGHYTFNDVLKANDMWAFFMSNARTRSRAFRYNDAWMTCDAGLTQLNNKWASETDSSLIKIAKWFFPERTPTTAKATLVALMPVAYETIVGVSDSAANLLRQNMMINLFYESTNSFNMNTDNLSASQAYINARSDLQTINTNLISGEQSGKWLIYMKTTLLLILVGVFIVMAPFATLPGGFSKFVKLYAGLFFMICMWGPIFAMLNSIQVNDSIAETKAIATGLTALSQNGITVVNARLASQASTFFGYIPYISMVLTGIGTGLAHMMQSSLSAAGSAASAVANDITTGNINLGNTQQGVHGYNNVSANKFDTSGSYKNSGIFSTTTDNGNVLTRFANGDTALNTSGAYSKLDSAGLFNKESVSQSLNKEGSRLIDSGTSQAKEFSTKRGAAISGAINNSMNRFEHKSNGSSWKYGADSRQSESARYIQNAAKRFADRFNVSEDFATSVLGQAWGQIKYSNGKDGGGFGAFGKIMKAVGVEAEVGARLQGSVSKNWKDQELQEWAKENLQSDEFNKSMEVLYNAGKDQNVSENSGLGIDGRKTYGQVADWSQTRIDSARADIRRGESYREASTEMANSSFDLSQNYQQAFYDWLKSDQGKGYTDNELSNLFSSKNMDDVRPLAQEFMQENSQRIFSEWKEKQQLLGEDYKRVTKESVESNYNKAKVKEVDNQDAINDAFKATKKAEQLPGEATGTPVKQKVEAALGKGKEQITQSQEALNVSQPPKNPNEEEPKTPVKYTPPVMIGGGYVLQQPEPINQPQQTPTKPGGFISSTPGAFKPTLNSAGEEPSRKEQPNATAAKGFDMGSLLFNNGNLSDTTALSNPNETSTTTKPTPEPHSSGGVFDLLNFVKNSMNPQPEQPEFSLIVNPPPQKQETPEVDTTLDLQNRMNKLTGSANDEGGTASTDLGLIASGNAVADFTSTEQYLTDHGAQLDTPFEYSSNIERDEVKKSVYNQAQQQGFNSQESLEAANLVDVTRQVNDIQGQLETADPSNPRYQEASQYVNNMTEMLKEKHAYFGGTIDELLPSHISNSYQPTDTSTPQAQTAPAQSGMAIAPAQDGVAAQQLNAPGSQSSTDTATPQAKTATDQASSAAVTPTAAQPESAPAPAQNSMAIAPAQDGVAAQQLNAPGSQSSTDTATPQAKTATDQASSAAVTPTAAQPESAPAPAQSSMATAPGQDGVAAQQLNAPGSQSSTDTATPQAQTATDQVSSAAVTPTAAQPESAPAPAQSSMATAPAQDGVAAQQLNAPGSQSPTDTATPQAQTATDQVSSAAVTPTAAQPESAPAPAQSSMAIAPAQDGVAAQQLNAPGSQSPTDTAIPQANTATDQVSTAAQPESAPTPAQSSMAIASAQDGVAAQQLNAPGSQSPADTATPQAQASSAAVTPTAAQPESAPAPAQSSMAIASAQDGVAAQQLNAPGSQSPTDTATPQAKTATDQASSAAVTPTAAQPESAPAPAQSSMATAPAQDGVAAQQLNAPGSQSPTDTATPQDQASSAAVTPTAAQPESAPAPAQSSMATAPGQDGVAAQQLNAPGSQSSTDTATPQAQTATDQVSSAAVTPTAAQPESAPAPAQSSMATAPAQDGVAAQQLNAPGSQSPTDTATPQAQTATDQVSSAAVTPTAAQPESAPAPAQSSMAIAPAQDGVAAQQLNAPGSQSPTDTAIPQANTATDQVSTAAQPESAPTPAQSSMAIASAQDGVAAQQLNAPGSQSPADTATPQAQASSAAVTPTAAQPESAPAPAQSSMAIASAQDGVAAQQLNAPGSQSPADTATPQAQASSAAVTPTAAQPESAPAPAQSSMAIASAQDGVAAQQLNAPGSQSPTDTATPQAKTATDQASSAAVTPTAAQPESAPAPAQSSMAIAPAQDGVAAQQLNAPGSQSPTDTATPQDQASSAAVTPTAAQPETSATQSEKVVVSQVTETQTKVETTQREVQALSSEQVTQSHQIKSIESQYADSRTSLNDLTSQVNSLKTQGADFDIFKPLNEQNSVVEAHHDDNGNDLKNSINQESLKQ